MSAQRTKVRDRYLSRFDGSLPGVRSAVYDVSVALWLLEKMGKENGLLDQIVTVRSGRIEQRSWYMWELLEIAKVALNSSIGPALWVYERLQQNEEAARLAVEADIFVNVDEWNCVSEALTDMLNNKAVMSRGFVSGARRVLARREKEQRENGGDAA
jgi:hypothetical protein